jgi:hypothetical protein
MFTFFSYHDFFPRIVNCLLDNVDEDEMTDLCEQRLLEIQYFMVRDFRYRTLFIFWYF